jgi:hypothetical protein
VEILTSLKSWLRIVFLIPILPLFTTDLCWEHPGPAKWPRIHPVPFPSSTQEMRQGDVVCPQIIMYVQRLKEQGCKFRDRRRNGRDWVGFCCFVVVWVVLGIEPSVLHMLGEGTTSP